MEGCISPLHFIDGKPDLELLGKVGFKSINEVVGWGCCSAEVLVRFLNQLGRWVSALQLVEGVEIASNFFGCGLWVF